MKPLQVLIGTIWAVTFLVSSARLSADIVKTSERKAAPGFTLNDAAHGPVRLSEHRGKVVLLDFWATWCAGCKVEIPWYMEFAKQYKGQGLVAIGVAMDEGGWKIVTPYLKQQPINYPIVVGDADLAKLYGISALPVTLLIDRNGKIAATHVGLVKRAVFEREIRKLLQENAKK